MNKLFSIFLIAMIASISFAYALPSVGDTGADTTYSGTNNYKVCRADQNSAWVSADNSGTYSPITVCQTLGYTSVEAVGGTCGTVCGYCGSSVETYDGAGGDQNLLRYTVTWMCGTYTGPIDDADVPEFGIIAGLAVLGLAGIFIYKKRS